MRDSFTDWCEAQDMKMFFTMGADQLRTLIALHYDEVYDEDKPIDDDAHAHKMSLSLRQIARHARGEVTSKPKKWSDDEDYIRFTNVYPKRRGGHNWKYAYDRHWLRKRRDGHTAAVMIDGARRYREFCEAEGKVDTVYVQMVSTFLNQENWLQAWDVEERKFIKQPPMTRVDPHPLPPSADELLRRRSLRNT